MRILKRYFGLALCILAANLTGFCQRSKEPMVVQPVVAASEVSVGQPAEAPVAADSPDSKDVAGQSIKFGPYEPFSAYANTSVLVLREEPEKNAPVIARLEAGQFEAVQILATSKNFVRVKLSTNDDTESELPRRERDFVGWTTWDAIVPDLTAVVLDAETGAVVARVPLTYGLSSVVFSPDGSRAIFHNSPGGIGTTAYEVRTTDYTFTRSLSSSEGEQFGALFYGPADGQLYANAYLSTPTLLRIGSDGGPNSTVELAATLKLSPDGKLGFVAHDKVGNQQTVDVLDMATMGIRNSFILTGSVLQSDATGFVLSKDGSELYIRLEDEPSPISVIDTRNGQVLRTLPIASAKGWTYFSQGDLVGDSLFLRVWSDESEGEEEPRSQNFWLTNKRAVAAEAGLNSVIEAGSNRFAVNEDGSMLFKLDENYRIQQRIPIDRPERGTDRETGNGLTVFGLSASPDGKQIIMFVGIEHGC